MEYKRCRICEIELTPETIYKNQKTLLCKKHLLSDPEKRRLHRIAVNKYSKKIDKTIKRKNYHNELTYKMRDKYPERAVARQKLRYAVKTGKIKKLPCEVCGSLESQGHHEDYTKPLEVRWLCVIDHNEIHRKYL